MKAVKKLMRWALAFCICAGIGCSMQVYAEKAEDGAVFAAQTEDGQVLDAVKEGQSEAIDVESGDKIEAGKTYNLMDQDGQPKFYQIDVPSDGMVMLEAIRVDAYGSLYVPRATICDSAQQELLELSSMKRITLENGTSEGVRSFAVKKGTYWLKTQLYSNTGELLSYTFKEATVSGNSSKKKAKTISPKETASGQFAIGEGTESNWYKFTIKSPQRNVINIYNYSMENSLSVTVSGGNAETEQFTLYPNDSLTLQMVNKLTREQVNWGKGTYYIQITKSSPDANAYYQLDRKAFMEALTYSKVSDQTYTGKAIKPSVTVKNGSQKLKKGTDYTISYKNNKEIGTATITIAGKGTYQGEKEITFKILPKATSLKKLTAGSKQLTVTWTKKSKIDGYEIRYATNKKLSGAKKTKVKKSGTTRTTIKKLKAKKTYYVQIRTYKKSGGKTYYSAWSKTLSKKTK